MSMTDSVELTTRAGQHRRHRHQPPVHVTVLIHGDCLLRGSHHVRHRHRRPAKPSPMARVPASRRTVGPRQNIGGCQAFSHASCHSRHGSQSRPVSMGRLERFWRRFQHGRESITTTPRLAMLTVQGDWRSHLARHQGLSVGPLPLECTRPALNARQQRSPW